MLIFKDSEQISYDEFKWMDSLDWYIDNTVSIQLTSVPIIITRNANKYLQEPEEFQSYKKWPFQLTHDLGVCITDYRKDKAYPFIICQDYCYDGATIPRFFWRLIGAPSDPRFLAGALIHDVLCQHHDYIDNDRKLSTITLERCLRCTDTSWITRTTMYWTVDIYQNLFRGW